MDRNCFIGIDIAKDTLDAHVLPSNEHLHCTTQPEDVQRLVRRLRKLKPTLIVLEATGGYEIPLAAELQQTKLSVAVVNPRQIRDFAKARGLLAKTDKLDAGILAEFAQRIEPPARSIGTQQERQLRALVSRRRQLIAMRTAELNRLHRAEDPPIVDSIQSVLDLIDEQLNDVDGQIGNTIRASGLWLEKATILDSVPGLGQISSHGLVGTVPELGRLTGRQISSLVGLAPFNNDSGFRRGKRTIRGGRADARKILYMPTLVATRHNPVIREFYQRLRSEGKPPKVAIVACMRKLLTICNAMIRDMEPWNPQIA